MRASLIQAECANWTTEALEQRAGLWSSELLLSNSCGTMTQFRLYESLFQLQSSIGRRRFIHKAVEGAAEWLSTMPRFRIDVLEQRVSTEPPPARSWTRKLDPKKAARHSGDTRGPQA